MSLTGKRLSLRIEIAQEGCRVKSIKPGKFDVSELLKSDDWMTPEELLQYGSTLEEYDFSWSKWNCKLPPGGIALNYERADRRKEHGEEIPFLYDILWDMEFNNERGIVDEQLSEKLHSVFRYSFRPRTARTSQSSPISSFAQSGCIENVPVAAQDRHSELLLIEVVPFNE
ncbi:hypothetical protein CEXT_735691 [Caerostris extrusa]|uniref:Uncharacterized protein n=1 Tax=Caerostris extrusa TaxID=172846 RepID=A0AAV4VZB9_CAEEX|nr:hypothetical protein CEXT_735691 [Caerostris extrusa]